jgi:hypothetical protein
MKESYKRAERERKSQYLCIPDAGWYTWYDSRNSYPKLFQSGGQAKFLLFSNIFLFPFNSRWSRCALLANEKQCHHHFHIVIIVAVLFYFKKKAQTYSFWILGRFEKKITKRDYSLVFLSIWRMIVERADFLKLAYTIGLLASRAYVTAGAFIHSYTCSHTPTIVK